MSDRDIPSVPVTTLAGLTSLSDLLSELPVSDSISSVTSLNKSLLFHTLVADESKNLLSVRDDNLVRQLVNAIEQTSSDHIELKPQYAYNQLGTNINESPELLQGIYTFRPTVFNTLPSQRIQINNSLNRNSPVSAQQQQQQQPRSCSALPQQIQNEFQPPSAQKSMVTTRHKAQLSAQHQVITTPTNNSNMQFVPTLDIKAEPDMRHGAGVAGNLSNITSLSNVLNINNYHPADASNQQLANTRQQQQQAALQSQQYYNQQHIQVQKQPQLNQSHIHQQQPQQQQQQPQHLQQTNVTQLGHQQQHIQQVGPSQVVQHTINQQHLQGQQQPHHVQQSQQSAGQLGHTMQQQILGQHPNQLHQSQMGGMQHHNAVGNSMQHHTNVHNMLQQTAQLSQAQQVISTAQQHVQVTQQGIMNQQTRNQQSVINSSQKQPVMNPQLPQQLMQKSPQAQVQAPPQHVAQQPVMPNQMQQQKTIPRNNEYLEQQSMNFDLRGPSPAQGSVAPESNQIGTPRHILQSQVQQIKTQETTSGPSLPMSTSSGSVMSTGCASSETNSSQSNLQSTNPHNKTSAAAKIDNAANILTPKVCLARLKIEDEKLMQESLTKFVKKSPELAKKLGLTDINSEGEADAVAGGNGDGDGAGAETIKDVAKESVTENVKENDSDSTGRKEKSAKVEVTQQEKNAIKDDIFSVMKADDRKNAAKRKLPVPVEIPPEEIFTKPKLRRVERIVMPTAPKTSKEEVMKSQTYQQFMKNMEQIIELLDDTEPPNFNSDDTDENVECISSKMLTVVSNDVAKLKAKGALDSIPKNKLTLLINYAMRNVYLARNYSAGPDVDEDLGGDDAMEKILNAIEACLLICNIYSTVKDLKFLQEDNISLIIKFVQFQFRETIFPSYDPVYTVKTMKKIDNRKKKPASNHNRGLQLLYSKSVELMKVFVTLFDKCIFVDTIVLALSTLAVEPFFVDGIETLQFVCLELVTTIFRKEQYVNMRSSILGDILASVDRLPCSKKNLRPFKLANNGGNIQMVTALVLQLIQCATVLPEALCEQPIRPNKKAKNNEADDNANKTKLDKDIVVLEKYDTAVSIGGNFLTTFLSKCKSRSSETDFRPLFENFIHDLLATVNKPEWPAAELLLSLLGTLLVKYMSDKSIEQSIRLASLDYLGIVAARLRKDTVESRCKVQIMDQMIKCIKAEQEKEGDLPSKDSKIVLDPEEERTEFLQKILLDFLAVNAQEENLIWDYARHFYLAQWYRDIMQHRKRIAEGEKGYASRKKTTKKKKRRGDESPESSTDDDDDKSDDTSVENMKSTSGCPDQELNLEIFRVLDERKKYLLGKIKPYSDVNCTSQHIKTYIDYNNAYLIAQYLTSKRPFSQSFDKYLQKIILVVREPAIAIRTRAMKCLANIVEVDPLILKRKDMQMGVNQKFLDTAISVREAAVDLIGKYVLSSEELIDQYYEMLSTRILDTGVSVRKRVIKILRDICIEYPDFDKIPEICVKMIRRVHDEEGIQKLVTEVFMRMWFTPCIDNDRVGVQRKITQIIDVVNSAHDTGTSWLDGLLNNIFAPKENNSKTGSDSTPGEPVKKNTEPPADVVLACQQLADGLVERLIILEEADNSRMLGCITTIYLLAKVRPQLLVRHAITIEPYLNIKCHSAIAPKFISLVAEILEQVVPLMEHPSESFLADLEEHLMVLVVSLNQTVVLSCLSCLGAVVNKITKNYKLIRDCFSRFYKTLANSRDHLVNNPNIPVEHIYQPLFRRSLYTVGILTRFFDFKNPQVFGHDEADGLHTTICEEVFECLMYFMNCSNFDIRKQALVSMGFFCVQNDEYLTRPLLKDMYRDLLTSPIVEAHVKTLCMRNILMYLNESEMLMQYKEKDWQTQAQTEDLKEMNDVMSGMASRIIQLYLTEILNCFLHVDSTVRLWAVRVVQIVLRQGLVHPVRMVPYLICLSTDEKTDVAHLADALLKDIDKTYAGFVNMKVQVGLQLSFVLQEIMQMRGENRIVRGFSIKEDQPVAMNDFLYQLLRNTKPQRRALVQTITKQFDDQKTTLRQMLYLADNLAYFPYVVQDEPLYLIHQIDIMISVTGTNLLANFKEGLKPIDVPDEKRNPLDDDDDDEDKDNIYSRLPEDTTDLQRCIIAAQGCMLLLFLKQHLKDMYGITDGKVSRYSPSEPQKIYEKAISRKQVPKFNPKPTIDEIKKEHIVRIDISENDKKDLIETYLEFKQLMLKLDPDDSDSQDEEKQKLNNSVTQTPKTPSATTNTNGSSDKLEQDNVGHVNNINNAINTMPSVVPVKEVSVTPTTRGSKSAPKGGSTRKQPARSKRKRRKIVSSDEEDSDYSGSDYA